MQKSPPPPPTAPEQPWLHQGDQKRRTVQRLFDEIAPSYDRLNRLVSLNLDRGWRRCAVEQLNLKPGDSVLDLCCGTGDFFPILRRKIGDGTLVGIDFSAPMLERAEPKDAKATRVLGDAMAIPLADSCVEAVTVGWGIRNVPDIDRAHQEIFRVLKPGGRFVSVDMAVPRNRIVAAASRLTCDIIVPRLGGWLSSSEAYTYLPESTKRFMSREGLKESMERAGFSRVSFIDKFLGNICIHIGHKP